MKPFSEIVQDERGRILGRYTSRSELMRDQLAIVRTFLVKITKQTGDSAMSKTKTKESPKAMEQTNICFIAGIVRTVKVSDDRAFLLIDVGPNSKFLPCTIYESHELLDLARRFRESDFIQVRGYVRGWSQKKNEKWENHVDIRITEIRNAPKITERPPSTVDDDVPF